MPDRLHDLLERHKILYGLICRDATPTDMELCHKAGYHVVWIDLEHSSLSTGEAVRLCRTIFHLGMIPAARIAELRKDQIFPLLDGGFQVLVLPAGLRVFRLRDTPSAVTLNTTRYLRLTRQV